LLSEVSDEAVERRDRVFVALLAEANLSFMEHRLGNALENDWICRIAETDNQSVCNNDPRVRRSTAGQQRRLIQQRSGNARQQFVICGEGIFVSAQKAEVFWYQKVF
jgi:hypothetical protein